MRTFSCFTTDRLHDVPSLSFIFAADEDRARELARREMLQIDQAVCVEVRENGRLVFVEAALPAKRPVVERSARAG